jgi:hypothetical protein
MLNGSPTEAPPPRASVTGTSLSLVYAHTMPNPISAPLIAFASRLRFPTLFKVTLGLMLLSWLLPDPVPFLDEIATALAALVLANWRRGPQDPVPPPPGREGVTLEGESRRE